MEWKGGAKNGQVDRKSSLAYLHFLFVVVTCGLYSSVCPGFPFSMTLQLRIILKMNMLWWKQD